MLHGFPLINAMNTILENVDMEMFWIWYDFLYHWAFVPSLGASLGWFIASHIHKKREIDSLNKVIQYKDKQILESLDIEIEKMREKINEQRQLKR